VAVQIMRGGGHADPKGTMKAGPPTRYPSAAIGHQPPLGRARTETSSSDVKDVAPRAVVAADQRAPSDDEDRGRLTPVAPTSHTEWPSTKLGAESEPRQRLRKKSGSYARTTEVHETQHPPRRECRRRSARSLRGDVAYGTTRAALVARCTTGRRACPQPPQCECQHRDRWPSDTMIGGAAPLMSTKAKVPTKVSGSTGSAHVATPKSATAEAQSDSSRTPRAWYLIGPPCWIVSRAKTRK
jgi:hypothetical protein